MTATTALPNGARRWAEGQLGHPILSTKALAGATTAEIHSLATEAGDFVLKRFVYDGFVAEEPDRAVHEAGGAQAALRTGVPVPRIAGLDPDGAAAGVPSVLMTKLPGDRLSRIPRPEAVAQTLVNIHGLQAEVPWDYQRYNPPADLYPPPWTANKEMWERAFVVISDEAPETASGFIHRDFHGDNLLWVGDRVSGIVDWLSACMGPFAIDVARCRLNFEWNGDRSGSDRFAEEYRRNVGGADHPYWDLVDAVDTLPYYAGPEAVGRWPAPGWPEEARGRHEDFIADALARLG